MNHEMTRNPYAAFQRIVGFSTQHGSALATTSRAIPQFAILAQWKTAARVERPRRKPNSKTPARPTPDAR